MSDYRLSRLAGSTDSRSLGSCWSGQKKRKRRRYQTSFSWNCVWTSSPYRAVYFAAAGGNGPVKFGPLAEWDRSGPWQL